VTTWTRLMPDRPVVAVAGATGAVGREMLLVLAERGFPAERVIALASSRSAGRRLPFGDDGLVVEEMTPGSFEGVDLALFSAGASVSREMAPQAVARGCVVIDNSSAFRMEEAVPLVVPEVNPGDIDEHAGIIANPNCSTIQLVVALKPLAALAPMRRVVVCTYQSASGAGQAAMDELIDHTAAALRGESPRPQAFAHGIAFNCIPHIDSFLDDGSTKEEWKMVVETRKIMHMPDIRIGVTCVRVPVSRCHSEAVHVEFASPVSVEAARAALETAPGVTVMDDPEEAVYPMPAMLSGTDDCHVGRIRADRSVEHGIAFWLVADQLRKGAALNAVQIAESLLPR
jgi:aspartate-semialdehyde dehydrogenase